MQATSPSFSRLVGGILLVAGSCIGAGMLGLPVLSGAAGFTPSIFVFLICWLFMVSTGFLLLEVNLWFGQSANLITMAEQTLGRWGKGVSWVVFLYLFYCLMVAYMAASGTLVADFTAVYAKAPIPKWLGSLLFSLIFGALIYKGTHAVDWFNRLLMGGLVVAYVTLILLGAKHVNVSLLGRQDWKAATLVVPIAVISFGYHNLLPSLTSYLDGHVRSLKWVILVGSAIPLLIYLIWEWLILGIVPAQEFQGALDQGELATQSLYNVVGSSWIAGLAQAFAFFAIITSFLSVALSFVDFLADGLGIRNSLNRIVPIALVLVPPFVFALLHPTIFLIALNYASGFGAVILFGIVPALMVWKGRYQKKISAPQLVPGGKFVLILIFLFSGWVMLLQVL